ncbi:MAG: hypothetical protein A3D92_06880 [Bacteroidetes bacterium RIFCSPHIGHO2_02_FULL_44_7]|nr:MAG: hypothetical protein A3D92_06880 [Bacteroidetes bacterium RIFCSPHIGHO2_02_FULL_44_7]
MSDSLTYPRISIVTTNFNGGQFLEETILSVIGQNYPNLEYILMDGGSTDNSLEIIEHYSAHFTFWTSEKDEGQYHAIQRGFERSTGDIMAWINSDDKYLPGAFHSVAKIFRKFPDIHWLMGLAREYTEYGALVGQIQLNWCRWSKYRYLTNDFQFIQQESSFWTRELWEKAGARLDTKYDLAADMELWARFFRYEKLHTTSLELSGFRHRREGQRSKVHKHTYLEEARSVVRREQALLPVYQQMVLPFRYLAKWCFGPFFFFDIPFFWRFYRLSFALPKVIYYNFAQHEFSLDDHRVKYPPMLIGKLQIHRKVISRR